MKDFPQTGVDRALVEELRDFDSREVQVCGWVHSLRLQRAMQFVILRDETGSVQITHRRADNEEVARAVDELTLGSALAVTGRVVLDERVKLGGLELVVDTIDYVVPAEPSLPVAEDSGPEVRLDWRFLDLRQPRQHAVFLVADTVEQTMRTHLHDLRFTELHSPKLMAGASESGAEVFKVQYFGTHAYLAQSPQFFKQMAIAAGFDRVMEVGPVFRAEPSFTSRHSTEFTGFDLEMAWIHSVEDVMALEETMLAATVAAVVERHGPLISELFGVEPVVPETPFPRVTMAEAREMLLADGWEPSDPTTLDLDAEGERHLCRLMTRRTGSDFVFVTEYPVSVRPFYHMRSDDDPSVTLSFDLLWNGLEVTTGAQREHRHEILLAQAREKGLEPDHMTDYLNAFRFGCPPHGGAGIGSGRLLMKLLGLDSLRDASLFFRGPNRLRP